MLILILWTRMCANPLTRVTKRTYPVKVMILKYFFLKFCMIIEYVLLMFTVWPCRRKWRSSRQPLLFFCDTVTVKTPYRSGLFLYPCALYNLLKLNSRKCIENVDCKVYVILFRHQCVKPCEYYRIQETKNMPNPWSHGNDVDVIKIRGSLW